MPKKKKGLGIAKPALQMTGGAVILGVGSSVATGTGTVGTAAAGGLTTMASFMPAMGAAVGGGLVLNQVKKLEKVNKRRRK